MLLLPRALSQFRLAALALVLLTVVTRLPSLLHPWSIDDEAVYSVVANEIVDGGRPYVDAVERKPPLLFWLYAGIFEATGKFNPGGLHAVALGWTLATMAGLYVIGRQLFDRGTGLVAALLYSVYDNESSAGVGVRHCICAQLPQAATGALGSRRAARCCVLAKTARRDRGSSIWNLLIAPDLPDKP